MEIALILIMLLNEVVYICDFICDLKKLKSKKNANKIEKNKLIIFVTCDGVIVLTTTCWLVFNCINYLNDENIFKSFSTFITLIVFVIVKVINYIVNRIDNHNN